MKKSSLQEQYELLETRKRIKKANKILKEINENKELKLILEALDASKVQVIVDDLEQIEKLVGPMRNIIPSLAKAADSARTDAQKELVPGIKNKIKSWLGLSGKLSKIMAFIGALKQGLAQVPNITKIVQKAGNVDKTKPLMDQLSSNKDVQQNATKILQAAFVPPGVFSGLKGLLGGGIPYVDNPGQMATELLNLSLDTLTRFSANMQGMQVPTEGQEAITAAKENPKAASGEMEGQDQAGEQANTGDEVTKTGKQLIALIKKKYPKTVANPAGKQKLIDKYVEFLKKNL